MNNQSINQSIINEQVNFECVYMHPSVDLPLNNLIFHGLSLAAQ